MRCLSPFLIAGAVSLGGPAMAQPIRIDLNRLDSRDAGCRVWPVFCPTAPGVIDPLRLNLVLFAEAEPGAAPVRAR